MHKKLVSLIPEIMLIKDDSLRQAVITTFVQALQKGGWQPEDMDVIPFTLLIPQCLISFLVHTRSVTQMCNLVFDEFNARYKEWGYSLNYDTLIAGAVLHDIGKLIEYEKTSTGQFIKSRCGRNLRHPFSGAAIAVNNNVPYEVAHIIANHAKEGDGTLRSPEAVVVNKIDMLNFAGIKACMGIL